MLKFEFGYSANVPYSRYGYHYAKAISVHCADGSYGILEELSESQP